MTSRDWDDIHKWFTEYTSKFKDSNGFFEGRQSLKVRHSLETSKESALIAVALGLPPSECIFASLLGLLHDIARLEQWSNYKTFVDCNSVDHGFLGMAILRASGCLEKLSKQEQNTVLQVTLHHNKKDLPRDMDSDLEKWCGLTRDADKIDILRVLIEDLDCRRGSSWDKADPSLPLSPRVKETFERDRLVNYMDVKSLKDLHLIHISWIYNLYFTESVIRLNDSGYWERLKSHMDSSLSGYIKEADKFISETIQTK